MNNNSEKKMQRNKSLQRHISEGIPTSEAYETSRDDIGVHDVPEIVEEKPPSEI